MTIVILLPIKKNSKSEIFRENDKQYYNKNVYIKINNRSNDNKFDSK